MARLLIRVFAMLAAMLALAGAASAADAAASCRAGTLYLTFDTGSMSQAELIARTLRRHHIRATFFLASEPTVNRDNSLDPTWAPYWKALAADGHLFGSAYVRSRLLARGARGQGDDAPAVRRAGREGRRDDSRRVLHGTAPQRPGIPVDDRPADGADLARAGRPHRCADAGLGRAMRLHSTSVGRRPASSAMSYLLRNFRTRPCWTARYATSGWRYYDGAPRHLVTQGPWAPGVLEPLLTGLEQKGFCFATLREHPRYERLVPTARAGGQAVIVGRVH